MGGSRGPEGASGITVITRTVAGGWLLAKGLKGTAEMGAGTGGSGGLGAYEVAGEAAELVVVDAEVICTCGACEAIAAWRSRRSVCTCALCGVGGCVCEKEGGKEAGGWRREGES